MSLTKKQEQFVREYLIDLNATQAARRAGYKNTEIGRQLITKNNVSAALQEAMQKRAERTEITQDWVLNELKKVAISNGSIYAKVVKTECPETISDEDTGELKTVLRVRQLVELENTDDLTDEQRAAISCIKQTRNGIEVGTYDKVKALELIGKHLGMFRDDAASKDSNEVKIIDDV